MDAVADDFYKIGAMHFPNPPESLKSSGWMGRIAYRLKGAQFKSMDTWNILELHVSKYFIPAAGLAGMFGGLNAAAGILAAVTAVSLAEKADKVAAYFQKRPAKTPPAKMIDVHDTVKKPFLHSLFHGVFSVISFGRLNLPKEGKLSEKLANLEYITTGPAQAMEIYSSKYLLPVAALLYVANRKKAAFVTLGVMAGISGAGQAIDSLRLIRTEKRTAAGLGRLLRGVGYGFGSRFAFHLAAMASTLPPEQMSQ